MASGSDSGATLRLLGTVVIAAAVIVSCWILGGAVVRARGSGEEIRVTGSARKPIRSDFAIWTARIAYRANDVSGGYENTKRGTDRLIAYLRKQGFGEKEIVRGALRTNKLFAASQGNEYQNADTFREIAGYDVSQTVEVRSQQVDKVEAVARESTELLAQGVALESDPPQYLYTKIADVKREILGEAAEDALKRAQEIASKSGAAVGQVRSVRMSPLQITSAYSTDVSGMGQYDTTAIDKAITAIVTVSFGIK